MAICIEVGKIYKIEDEQKFRWSISDLRIVKGEDDFYLKSPRFDLPDSSWYLTLYPKGCARYHSKGSGLFLNRADNGYPKIITYTLEIHATHFSNTFTKTRIFSRRDGSSGEPRLLKKGKKKSSLSSFPEQFSSEVIFTYQINNYEFTSLQETSTSVSCAIQTDVPDSVPCAIQTEMPDCASCAIQTEVPDRVIDKENSKDEDEPSLDTKEDKILRSRMKELLIKSSDYDVTICVQDKKFRAHRIILSARSPVFAMMLTHDTKENNTGTISIEDCDPDSFNEFLLYVYSGRTENLTPSKALQLYYTADKYDFPVLKERCVSLLKTSLSIMSICDVILLAAKHQEKELLEVASEFFARNMEEILVSVSWQTFMIQNPVEANELYIKSMKILVSRK